jgi:hypothetical protein
MWTSDCTLLVTIDHYDAAAAPKVGVTRVRP